MANPALKIETVAARVEILPMAEEHIAGFTQALDVVARERRYLAMLEAPPAAKVREFVERVLANDWAQFVAVAEGRVVGWCDILPKERPIHSHVGVVGMGLLNEWRGLGIGERLLRAAIDKACAGGITRIELQVYADNARAKRLYQRLGFRTEGFLRHAGRIDGEYRDMIAMSLMREAPEAVGSGGQ